MRHVKSVTKRHPITAQSWFEDLCLCVTCDSLPTFVQLMIPWYCQDAWSDLFDKFQKG